MDEVAFLLGHRDATVTRVVYIREIADARRRHMRRSRMTAESPAPSASHLLAMARKAPHCSANRRAPTLEPGWGRFTLRSRVPTGFQIASITGRRAGCSIEPDAEAARLQGLRERGVHV